MQEVTVGFIDGSGFSAARADVFFDPGNSVLSINTETGAVITINWNYVSMFSQSDPE